MEHSKKLAHATLAGILSLATVQDDALAQTTGQDQPVKCYGVAAAGKNACGTTYSACAGQINVPKACYAWVIAADATTCLKEGGSVGKPVAGCVEPNPAAVVAKNVQPVTKTKVESASVAPVAAAPTSDHSQSESSSFLSFLKKWF